MQITQQLTDAAVLGELSQRLRQARIDMGLTQAALATQAGVSKRTVERLEDGASAQLSTLIRILRSLDLLPRLDALLPATGPRPMELLRHATKRRQRASTPRSPQASEPEWQWGDDE